MEEDVFATPMQDREQEIRERAYEIYRWRLHTGHDGTAETDWLEAEKSMVDDKPLKPVTDEPDGE